MANYLQRALQSINETEGFNAAEGDVMAHGLSADGREYTVVLNLGIKGCPKYRLALDTLPKLKRPEPVKVEPPQTVEVEPTWPSSALMDDTEEQPPEPTEIAAETTIKRPNPKPAAKRGK